MKQDKLNALVEDHTKNLINSLLEEISHFQNKNKISNAEFARMLGCNRSYIAQLFNNTFDHKLSKLVLLSLAIGKMPKIYFEDIRGYYIMPDSSSFDIREPEN